MADLTSILLAASRADKQAADSLNDWENSNFAELAHGLSVELATDGKPAAVRQLAALYLKNMLNAKDVQLQNQKHQRWKSLDGAQRNPIKDSLLIAIRSNEAGIPHVAAVCASEIAAVELPYNEWPNFIPTVLEYVSHAQSSEMVKIASLECLGFTCERIAELSEITECPDIPEAMVDSMLTAIVSGISAGQPEEMRYVAAEALKNSLLFCQKNMEKKQERDAIMTTICGATTSSVAKVREKAFQCIASIASLYYEKINDYMSTFFDLTVKTIPNDEEAVAMSAIEFWNVICEVEQDRIDEAMLMAEQGLPAERHCVRYTEAAVGQLVPLLLETLTKQEEDLDDDTFNLHMAGNICLCLVSQTVEDKVVPFVMPFVLQNIQSENWRFRDAAIMAFISILDGPATETIGGPVSQSIPALLSALADQNAMVRDSAAHCISQICRLHVRSIPNEMFPNLIQELMNKCSDESPKVASHACTAIHNLANAFAAEASDDQQTNALSSFMSNLLQTLWRVCDREDSTESNLRVSAMESMALLIQVSAQDAKNLLIQLLPAVVTRLEQALSIQAVSRSEIEIKEQLEGLLCALIQVLFQKLEKAEVAGYPDKVMTLLIQVLQAQNASCHEEVFNAISAVADNLEEDFAAYMPGLKPFLVEGLRSFQSFRLCTAAVGTAADICHAIEDRITPYCDEIMGVLVDSLKDVTIDRYVKPPVISCFGDIALAIGGAYEPYLQLSAMMLMQASTTQAPDDDDDLIEYVNTLRKSILEAYTGIVQGLCLGGKLNLFVPYVSSITQFLGQLSADTNRDDEVLNKAIALIGDIAQAMGSNAEIQNHLRQPFVAQLLRDGMSSRSEGTREVSQWCSSLIPQVLQ